jgi:SAM-dependent methyltransferase
LKKNYLTFYDQRRYSAPFSFLADYHAEKEPRKKLALWNRLRDYTSILLARDKNLLSFHKELNQILLNQSEEYAHYDYGEGYFYQSFASAHISGFRNTEERVHYLGLNTLVENKRILDIGCNTGFLLLSLANSYKYGFGFDINPYIVEIANKTKSYLKINNTDFIKSSFEDLQPQPMYDVVLSFANHATFDKNTKQDISSYFQKIASILNDDGMLVFESHPPDFEDKTKLENVINVIKTIFHIDDIKQLPLRGFLDKGRTYAIASKK